MSDQCPVCPVCRKQFVILWPSLWAYKRENKYLCSYGCMRAFDRNEENKMDKTTTKRSRMSPEAMAVAVEMFKAGDGNLDKYLEDHGVTNIPKWKSNTRQRYGAPEQRETYHGTFHNENRNPPPPPPGYVATMKVDGAPKIETPEANKVEAVEVPENVVKVIEEPQLKLKPGLRGLNNSDFTVSAIKHPQLGEFYYDQKFNSVDWRSPEGEEISMSPKNWKELYLLIPDVMGILGVPDDE